MSLFENINISFSFSPLLLYIGILVIVLYTIYIYKITLPKIGLISKSILIFLRASSLLLILLLIFDPILNISRDIKVEPKSLVFVDNSKSISEFSDEAQISVVKDLIKNINSNLGTNANFYSFGNSVTKIREIENDTIEFVESSTRFNQIANSVNEERDVSSILIISDGIINQGENPLYELSNLNIPIYTIGIGDSIKYSDISIEQIRNNSTLYTNRETEIEVIIRNNDSAIKSTVLQVFDNGILLLERSVKLSSTGVDRFRFPFLSETDGLHRITIKAKASPIEKNINNNVKSATINVLSSKKKIAVIAGNPSSDLSAILKSIKKNENYEVYKIIELGNGRFYDDNKDLEKVSNSDIIFLIGFPTISSDGKFIDEIFSIIKDNKKNLFLLFTPTLDLNRLSLLKNRLTFNILGSSISLKESQVESGNIFTGLLGRERNFLETWSNLPPIAVPRNKINLEGKFEVLLTEKKDKIPVLFTNSAGNTKNIILTGMTIWKWKLNSAEGNNLLFDNLIMNSIKWLSLDNEDFFTIKLNKNNYRLGEDVIFKANVYDKTFEPLSNEKVLLRIFDDTISNEYIFTPLGNGIYEANVKPIRPGIYNYEASLGENTLNLPIEKGSFNIEEIELELAERKLNKIFLINLASESGGKYYELNQTNNLIRDLNFNYKNKIYYNKIDKELRLSNFELILLIIVLLLSTEWITRKVLRMI